ncbi:MAG: DNA polymerase III subunit gamma/tau, partial [candidate division Zixibacteria bacterium]|nr:DNA polymerase III subunit gamma/tau [candidate division Zixibacteria bacterium]
ARVLAKSLNCKNGPTATPCGECSNCLEIKQGNSPDVFEIDAASNRGIDDIRELRENVRYSPAASRYKIYIIDEVHRLTHEAFDALLKTLEEPPPHVIFIFATTEPQALPATILSRTQRFDFRRVPVSALAEAINNVAAAEGIAIEPKAALLLARKADGSLRDALSLLDQLINFGQSGVTAELAEEVLGIVKTDFLFELFEAIANHQTQSVIELFEKYFGEGGDVDELADEISAMLRKLLLIKNGVDNIAILEMDNTEKEKAGGLVADIDTADILRMLKLMADYIGEKKSGIDPVVAMELTLTRMANLDRAVQIEKLIGILGNPGPVQPSNRFSGHQTAASKFREADNLFSPQPAAKSLSININVDAHSSQSQSAVMGIGSFKPEDVNQWWSQFLAFVKEKRMAIWSHLQHTKAELSKADTIKIGIPGANDYLMKYLAKDNRDYIVKKLAEFCGTSLDVEFVKIEGMPDNRVNGVYNGNINGKTNGAWSSSVEQHAKEFLNQHPQIKKLHDLINGEDVGFKGSV